MSQEPKSSLERIINAEEKKMVSRYRDAYYVQYLHADIPSDRRERLHCGGGLQNEIWGMHVQNTKLYVQAYVIKKGLVS